MDYCTTFFRGKIQIYFDEFFWILATKKRWTVVHITLIQREEEEEEEEEL